MITGDHKVTATAIAKQIGIFGEGDIALVGPELDAMPDKELDHLIGHIAVFARVSPENKIRIVEAWQRRGSVVAMTGDGVNDAPALKAADIGVAMGITGTEVSKDAAAMILTDDNFATIIKAVANGRNVYKNIKNAILFLLSGNMAGALHLACSTSGPVPAGASFVYQSADRFPSSACHRYGTGGERRPQRKTAQSKRRNSGKALYGAASGAGGADCRLYHDFL